MLNNLKNKKGFSLVELLVGFAIFSVISVAIVGFITMSSRSYQRSSEVINLQIEYQIVMNMLNEYIMDCNYEIGILENGIYIINQSQVWEAGDGDNEGKYVTQYMTYAFQWFRLNEHEAVLNFNSFPGLQRQPTVEEDDPRVSRNVTDFSIDDEGNGLIAVTMTFETPTSQRSDGSLRRREYSATQLISLRNSPEIVDLRTTNPPDEGGDNDEDD
jgi:prepilin-type N-terminal cleavage/methylation domain-containing protein